MTDDIEERRAQVVKELRAECDAKIADLKTKAERVGIALGAVIGGCVIGRALPASEQAPGVLPYLALGIALTFAGGMGGFFGFAIAHGLTLPNQRKIRAYFGREIEKVRKSVW